MATANMTTTPSALDALMAHFASSSKSVQHAFAKYIIDGHAAELEAARQQQMVKLSLTQAVQELKEGNTRPVEDLLAEL